MYFFVWRQIPIILLVGLILVPLGASGALTWQSEPFSAGLHYDSRHSGFSRLDGPEYPDANVKWSYTAVGMGKINSSCAIGPAEPYLDTNGNGVYDVSEPYEDLNGNGVWDNCMIVFTSTGGFLTVLNPDGTLFWNYDANTPMVSSPAIGPGEPYFDANGNGCFDIAEPFTDLNGNGRWDDAEPFLDKNLNGEYDIGEPFTDLNYNHKWDDAEPFVDANGNGVRDLAEPFIDENGNNVRDRCVFYFGGDDGRLCALYSEICEEPFVDRNGDGEYSDGETFIDWNGNGRWDRVRMKWSVATAGPITSSPVVDVQEPFCDLNGNNWHDAGEPFLDVFQDLQWNPGSEEPYQDINRNGRFDADFPEPYVDTNRNGRHDGVMVYVGSHDGRIYGVSQSGEVIWTYPTGSWVSSSPAVSVDGKVVYCGSDDHYLYAIDGANGYLLWRRYLGGPVHASPAVDGNGNIYIGSDSPDNRLYAFASDGTPLWSRSVGTWVHSSPAIGIYGDIYCGTYYDGPGQEQPVGKLFSVAPNGFESGFTEDPNLKGITLGSWVQSSPMVDASGNIYMISGDNTVFSVSPDGVIIGRMSLPTGSDQSPQKGEYWIKPTAAIGPDRTLYVGCWDGVMYALQRDIYPSADEPNILIAGYMDSEVSASVDSVLKVRALVIDPENNVVKVRVLYEGIDLGWALKREGYDEIADAMIFSSEFVIPASYIDASKAYALQLIAEDAVGNESQMWPNFFVTREGHLPTNFAPDWRRTRGMATEGAEWTRAASDSAPIVLMAGNPYSRVTYETGGRLSIAALVTDPDGIYDIASVTWKYPPLGVSEGVDITPYAIYGLYKDAVLYYYSIQINPGVEPIALENYILAVDKEGHASTQFPAITIVP